jgi:GNAT superfamily N-acetyltransferase
MSDYEISADRARVDVDAVHAYLTRSYWSAGIPREIVARAIAHSICFSAFRDGAQVGFARIVTDHAVFAYLADVYVLEAHRGRGVSKRLMQALVAHPDLKGLRRMHLVTNDAHGLYAQFGFKPLAAPERHMELHNPNVYAR